eukprot:1157457-Pelagomonas_calceolata.AAC.7
MPFTSRNPLLRPRLGLCQFSIQNPLQAVSLSHVADTLTPLPQSDTQPQPILKPHSTAVEGTEEHCCEGLPAMRSSATLPQKTAPTNTTALNVTEEHPQEGLPAVRSCATLPQKLAPIDTTALKGTEEHPQEGLPAVRSCVILPQKLAPIDTTALEGSAQHLHKKDCLQWGAAQSTHADSCTRLSSLVSRQKQDGWIVQAHVWAQVSHPPEQGLSKIPLFACAGYYPATALPIQAHRCFPCPSPRVRAFKESPVRAPKRSPVRASERAGQEARSPPVKGAICRHLQPGGDFQGWYTAELKSNALAWRVGLRKGKEESEGRVRKEKVARSCSRTCS